MRGFEILLVLFLWFALCSAYPKKRDDRPSIDEDDPSALLRRERSILDPIGNIGGITTSILSPPSIPNVSQLISSAVKSIVDWLLRVPLQIPMAIVVRIINFLSSLFPTSFAFLPKSIDEARDYIRKGASSLLQKAISAIWNFLSTRGLPWLHQTLGQIEKVPSVPVPVRTLITNFNTAYNVAVMLRIINPAY